MTAVDPEPEQPKRDTLPIRLGPDPFAKPDFRRQAMLRDGWNPETLSWDPDSIAGQVIKAYSVGCSIRQAAEHAGLGYYTVIGWRRRGAAHEPPSGDDNDIDFDNLTQQDILCLWFNRRWNQARASTAVEMAEKVVSAGKVDARFAVKWLERKDPSEWAPHTNVNVSSNDTEDQSVTPEDLRALMAMPETRDLIDRIEGAMMERTQAALADSRDDEIVDAEIVED